MLTDKIHFAPGETVTLQTGNQCRLTGEIDNAQVVQGSFVASGFGGFTITDQKTGQPSVFTVSSNPLDVGVGGQLGSLGFTGDPKCLTAAAQLAANYQTVGEYVFFGPSDCMNLDWSTQPGGVGFSGQGHYPQSDALAQQAIAGLKAKGITPIVYCNSAPCGPAGWAWAAANSNLCIKDPFGNLAPQDPAIIAGWNSWTTPGGPPAGNPLAGHEIWQTVRVDWSNPAAIQAAVAGLQVAVKRYGFAAIRLDGFPDVPGNAAATMANAVAVRQGMDGVAAVGANFGRNYPADAHAAVYASDGGLALTEAGGTWQDGLAINAAGGNWYQCNAPYAFPAHPMYGQGMTVAQNQWLLRWSGFLWDRSAYLVTTSPSVGTYVKTRRGADGLRYDVLFFTQPGTYQLPSPAAAVSTPEGVTFGTSSANIKTFGIAIWKINDILPTGTITVTCDHGSSGYTSTLDAGGRQWRPDLSTSADARGPTYPFLGFASLSPMPPGTYQPLFRIWYEPDSRGALIHLRIEDNGTGKDISTLNLGTGGQPFSSGWGYQDYRLPPITLTSPGNLQASVYPVGKSFSALHLDSVSFVPV